MRPCVHHWMSCCVHDLMRAYVWVHTSLDGCVHDWMRAYVCCDVHDKIQTCPSRILTHAHAPTLWHTNPMPMQACSRAQRAETQEDCHLPADVMAWR